MFLIENKRIIILITIFCSILISGAISLAYNMANSPKVFLAQVVAPASAPTPSYSIDVDVKGLNIIKRTIGGDGIFHFNTTIPMHESFDIDTYNGLGSYFIPISEILPGEYSITEIVPRGWKKTEDSCEKVKVIKDGYVTCSIINTASGPGSIVVNKITQNGNGTFTLDLIDPVSSSLNPFGPAPIKVLKNFTITTANGFGSYTISDVPAGIYSITENPPVGWLEIQNSCGDIMVNPGETTTCSITNQWTLGLLPGVAPYSGVASGVGVRKGHSTGCYFAKGDAWNNMYSNAEASRLSCENQGGTFSLYTDKCIEASSQGGFLWATCTVNVLCPWSCK